MALIVKKFGGSSVGSTEKIMNVAKRIIEEKKPGDQIVMVVSAMGDTTDDLIELAKGINSNPYQYSREMDMLPGPEGYFSDWFYGRHAYQFCSYQGQDCRY